MKTGLSSAILIGALLGAVPAFAQSSDAALAETLFQEGKRLMAAGNHAAACPKFEDSYKLDPGTGTLMNLGACLEGLGKYASAWSVFHDAMSRAKREGQDARAKSAKDRIRGLEDRLTRVVIAVPDKARVPGLVIKLDDTTLATSAFGVPAPINPGVHAIVATAPGKKTARISIEAGSTKKMLETTIPVLEDGQESAAPAAAAPDNTAGPSSGISVSTAATSQEADTGSHARSGKTLGLVIGAAGVVAIGVGGVFAALTKSEDKEAASLCTRGAQQNQCADPAEKAAYESHTSSAKTDALGAYLGFGIGGAALITGAVLILTSKPSTSASASVPVVAPVIGHNGAGAVATINW